MKKQEVIDLHELCEHEAQESVTIIDCSDSPSRVLKIALDEPSDSVYEVFFSKYFDFNPSWTELKSQIEARYQEATMESGGDFEEGGFSGFKYSMCYGACEKIEDPGFDDKVSGAPSGKSLTVYYSSVSTYNEGYLSFKLVDETLKRNALKRNKALKQIKKAEKNKTKSTID
ncbi:hypothetical protein [Arenicella chitinivorans]|nr:hypothetical protein [Arenicella chitinivorans]